MGKATNKGTCQCCGSVQKLPNGNLSQHGYTVDWGLFQGVCQGAGHLPFEQSKDLVDHFIAEAHQYVAEINEKIVEASNSVDDCKVWFRNYHPATYSRKAFHLWEQRAILCDRWFEDNERFTIWKWVESGDDKRNVNRGKTDTGGCKKTIEEAVKFENAKYVEHLEKKRQGIFTYIKWQQDRISGWKVQPLLKLT